MDGVHVAFTSQVFISVDQKYQPIIPTSESFQRFKGTIVLQENFNT